MLEISLSCTPQIYLIHLYTSFFFKYEIFKNLLLRELSLQRTEDSTIKDYEQTVSSNIQVYARSTKLYFKKTCSTQKGIGLINLKKIIYKCCYPQFFLILLFYRISLVKSKTTFSVINVSCSQYLIKMLNILIQIVSVLIDLGY